MGRGISTCRGLQAKCTRVPGPEEAEGPRGQASTQGLGLGNLKWHQRTRWSTPRIKTRIQELIWKEEFALTRK